MRITDINRSRVATAIVRGYFHAFFSGQIDALSPDKKKLEPQEYKQLLVNSFDNLSSHFVSVLFPVLIRLNYDDLDQVTTDMKRRHFSSSTSSKLLLRYACGAKALYDLVTAEYQKNVYALLEGHLLTKEEFFSSCPTLQADDTVPVSLAIRSIVRVQMQAYATGVTSAQSSTKNLRQATIYRLMLSGMESLLHDSPISFEEENLELMFRKVSLNSDNFERLMDEMTQAYTELV
ncbi:MAG: hypothetical protein ACTTKT_01910 [Prevotella veroralis]